MNATHGFGILLVATATMLQAWQWQAWGQARRRWENESDVLEFSRRQFHRRTFVAVLLALSGLLCIAGASNGDTFVQLATFSAVALLAMAVATLAMADSLASRKFFGGDAEQQRELSALKSAIDTWKAEQKGNRPDEPRTPDRPPWPEPSEN